MTRKRCEGCGGELDSKGNCKRSQAIVDSLPPELLLLLAMSGDVELEVVEVRYVDPTLN